MSVNCIAPALCPAESREELIRASRHFVRVGDERDRHVLDSHVHAESVRVAELHVTSLNHLPSLIEAKERTSNRSEAHAFRGSIVAKTVAIHMSLSLRK